MDYAAEENRESLAEWQHRKSALGGILPGETLHWAPYAYDFRDKSGNVRLRCAICNKMGSNDKMQMVECVLGGEVRCWDDEVIATFEESHRADYEKNTRADGGWNQNECGYMGWWFVGSECAKHIHPSLMPPKEAQARVREGIVEREHERKAEEDRRREEKLKDRQEKAASWAAQFGLAG